MEKTAGALSISVFFFAVWLSVSAVWAGNVDILVVPPPDEATAGREMVFSIYFYNNGETSAEARIPEALICRLKCGDREVESKAWLVEPPGRPATLLPPAGFRKVRYALIIPDSFRGPIRMAVQDLAAPAVMFAVLSAPPPVKEGGAEGQAKRRQPLTPEDLFSLYQPYLGSIGPYEPIYFLVGTEPEKSKFQISLKHRFFSPRSSLAQEHPWVEGFHFGYTQTSFWDLKSPSAPFKDTSYKPELFFVSPATQTGLQENDWLYLQTGLQHESNGRDEDASRSTNYFYIKPIFLLYDETTHLGLMAAPRIWTYIGNDEQTNPDLADYRGYFDLELAFGKAESFVLKSHLRWAQEGPSVQMDFTYPLSRILLGNLDLYFQVEYVNALAESLLNYTERTQALRIGFALVR